MSSPALPESPLMTMLLHRCGLDERAFGSLHGVEAAAWDAIVDHTESDVLRQVLASIRAELPMQGELPAPALRLLGAIATARTAGVPGDVLASFTDDALRTALMVWDAFQRGYDVGRAEASNPPARRSPLQRRRWPH
ncbi:MAG: hypothetical protein JNK56_39295 [Myxococcales bacterium]|nr:hypothetical protein [Myxococcales bacterium]